MKEIILRLSKFWFFNIVSSHLNFFTLFAKLIIRLLYLSPRGKPKNRQVLGMTLSCFWCCLSNSIDIWEWSPFYCHYSQVQWPVVDTGNVAAIGEIGLFKNVRNRKDHIKINIRVCDSLTSRHKITLDGLTYHKNQWISWWLIRVPKALRPGKY